MIRGIGIVIVTLQELSNVNDKEVHQMIWTPGELEYCQAHRSPELYFAARYAAKLAVLKALGVEQGREQRNIPLTAIEIQRLPSGKPYLVLRSEAAALAAHMQIVRWHLSLTHKGIYAAAFTLAEGKDTEGLKLMEEFSDCV